jgi:hypothetical protein
LSCYVFKFTVNLLTPDTLNNLARTAARKNQLDKLKILVKYGASMESPFDILSEAVEKADLEMVTYVANLEGTNFYYNIIGHYRTKIRHIVELPTEDITDSYNMGGCIISAKWRSHIQMAWIWLRHLPYHQLLNYKISFV